MEVTHFSSKKEESNHARKPIRRILAFSNAPENSINNKLQTWASKSEVHQVQSGDLVMHVSNDVNEKEAIILHKDTGRERLKRHREEMCGRVMIPDSWGQENLLKDWIDYSSFDKLLAPNGLASAREALVAEGRRRPTSQRLRIESRC